MKMSEEIRNEDIKGSTSIIEGRHAVLEAIRSGNNIERLFVLDGNHDGPVETIRRAAKKSNIQIRYVDKEYLDNLSVTGKHQGVICKSTSYDNIEDPHNLGAIIRTAEVSGAHGIIITRDRAASLSQTVERASAGAIFHIPVVKVTNMSETIKKLKNRGLWFVCADMEGEVMYKIDMRGAIGIVIGNEGSGVGTLVKKNCDFTA